MTLYENGIEKVDEFNYYQEELFAIVGAYNVDGSVQSGCLKKSEREQKREKKSMGRPKQDGKLKFRKIYRLSEKTED